MFIKPFDMMNLVRLPGNSRNHVEKTKVVKINVALFAQFNFLFDYVYT